MEASTSATVIFTLKIGLQGIKPPIWRRIEVPDSYTFFDLHVAIQDMFQWSGDHLHKFEMVKPKRDMLSMLLSGNYELDEYIGIPDRSFENDYKILPENETRLRDQFAMADNKKKCVYTYDFGFEWKHDILLEKISEALPNVVYPRCTDGKRQPPPEHRPPNWPFPNEPPFSKSDLIFRDPKVVWEANPFKSF